jgi:hypothetical protein
MFQLSTKNGKTIALQDYYLNFLTHLNSEQSLST